MTSVAYVSLSELQKRAVSPAPWFNGFFQRVDDGQAKQVVINLY